MKKEVVRTWWEEVLACFRVLMELVRISHFGTQNLLNRKLLKIVLHRKTLHCDET
jgi:hypothetical protein